MGHRKFRSQFSVDGHKKFEDAKNPDLAQSKKQNLAEAECFYQKCLENSKTSEEKASSCKHLGTLNWWAAKDAAKDVSKSRKAGKAVVDAAESVRKQNEVKERLKKCVEYFLRANDGQVCVDDVEKWGREIIRWSSELLDARPASFTPVMTLETSKWGAECYLKLAGSIFERGTKWLEIESSSSKVPGQEGYMECRRAMWKCEDILQLNCIKNIDLEGRVKDLKWDVQTYLKDCEAIQYNIQGEGYLEKGMNGKGGMISAAIDCFTSARKTGIRPEYKAFAYSRLGKLYCFLGDDSRAHYNHNRSVDIAGGNLSPRVESAEWYIYSREAVEKHRMEETRGKVTAVEEAAKNTKNLMCFINYLYEKLPHPNLPHPNKKPGPVSEKIAWNEAAKIYHPDRNTKESEHWQLLCNTIMTKLIEKKPT